MRSIFAFSILLAMLALPISACHEPMHDSSDIQKDAGSDEMPSSGTRVGWSQLRRGMTSSEVIGVLGDPSNVKVEMTFTYWYYSSEGESGPYVYFGSRDMTVIGWREP